MPKNNINEVQLVRVTTDERDRQIWVAATPREHAVDYVLSTIPEDGARGCSRRE